MSAELEKYCDKYMRNFFGDLGSARRASEHIADELNKEHLEASIGASLTRIEMDVKNRIAWRDASGGVQWREG